MLPLLLTAIVVAAPVQEKADEKKILASLQGEWTVDLATLDGTEVKELKGVKVTIEKTTMKAEHKEMKLNTVTFTLDVGKTPMEMDSHDGDKLVGRAIFELEGDTLRICSGGSKTVSSTAGGKTVTETTVEDRPASFDGKAAPVMTLKRVKK